MSDTTYTNGVTLTDDDWFNDLNRLFYTIFGDPATLAAAFARISGLTGDTSPDGAADYVLTYDDSATTAKKVLLNTARGRFKVGTFTRDLSAASGTVSYTGVGFTPRAVVFIAGFAAGGEPWSVGFDDGDTVVAIYRSGGGFPNGFVSTVRSISYLNGTDAQAGNIDSFGSDGFDIDWVKTNSPTGTFTVGYLAIE